MTETIAMSDAVVMVFEYLAAGVSIALMGICAVKLLLRFIRVLRGEEPANGIVISRKSAPAMTTVMYIRPSNRRVAVP